MSFRTPTNGYKGLPDAVLESETQIIIASIVSNPNFPTPEPSIADLNTSLSAFSTAVSKAASGDRVEIEIKKQKKEALALNLNLLANYVAFMSKGDVAVLQSSGFKLSKVRTNLVLGAIESFSVSNGVNPGELVTHMKIKNAKSFVHQYTPDPLTPQSVWMSEGCTSSKCTMKGLESGKKYWCRVTALGSREQTVTTSEICRVVL